MELIRGEALMLSLGLCFFRGHGSIDVAAMAQELDAAHWEGALEAIKVSRSGFGGPGERR